MIYRERALRHEYKFPATAAQCEILRERFSAVMTPDAHGENGCYRITSVYLDDVYRTAYNDKLIGADTRKKYRIRTYDLSDKLLHFECKYKDRDMTSKRGIWISPEQYYSEIILLYGAANMRGLSLRTHLTAIRWLCSARLL